MQVERLLHRQDLLGEGMMWLEDSRRIAWVDILNKRLMIASETGTDLCCYEQATEIGAVLPAATGELVLVLRNQVVAFDEASGKTRLIWSAKGLEPESNRFNDATIDPAGNLWVGSMDFDAEAPTGNLWRVTPDGEASKRASGFQCLNGPAFSRDGKVLYLGNTMRGQVLAYDLDLSTGALANRRVFVDLTPFGGFCDGMTVDLNDNLWVCQITAGRIGCFSPDGHKLHSVALPVPMVTSCCFSGADYSELFATTARILLDEAELAAYPDSGSLYRIKTGLRGARPTSFGAT
jgi:sugar lactone lactonase YvrE